MRAAGSPWRRRKASPTTPRVGSRPSAHSAAAVLETWRPSSAKRRTRQAVSTVSPAYGGSSPIACRSASWASPAATTHRSETATIDQERERVRSTPADVVAVELERSLPKRRAPPPGLRKLLADPAATERLRELLERCWQLLLAPWWERVRDLLDADVAFRARRLADGGLERLFAELDPSIRFDGDTLAVKGRGEGHRDLAGEGLVLIPSAFVWPGWCWCSTIPGSRP
jgi:Family of unknown function (DUF5937)